MSISKASWAGPKEYSQTRTRTEPKWAAIANTFLTSISIMSVLDLLLAYFRNDTLSNYTMSVLLNLILTTLGLIICSDFISSKDHDSKTCFLAYMIFLWVCTTVLKLVF